MRIKNPGNRVGARRSEDSYLSDTLCVELLGSKCFGKSCRIPVNDTSCICWDKPMTPLKYKSSEELSTKKSKHADIKEIVEYICRDKPMTPLKNKKSDKSTTKKTQDAGSCPYYSRTTMSSNQRCKCVKKIEVKHFPSCRTTVSSNQRCKCVKKIDFPSCNCCKKKSQKLDNLRKRRNVQVSCGKAVNTQHIPDINVYRTESKNVQTDKVPCQCKCCKYGSKIPQYKNKLCQTSERSYKVGSCRKHKEKRYHPKVCCCHNRGNKLYTSKTSLDYQKAETFCKIIKDLRKNMLCKKPAKLSLL